MAEIHRLEVRVYYEDTDFSGFVYHAAYLRFMERGRTELLRSIGVHHAELAAEGLAFAVRSMSLHFDAAARIDDLLEIETSVQAVGGVRLSLHQAVRRGETVLVRAEVEVVAVRMGGGATRLPRRLLEQLRA